MVNDSSARFSNCTMKKKHIAGEAVLMLYSLREIEAGEELRYDSGIKGDWRKKGLYPKPLNENRLPGSNNIDSTSNEESGDIICINGVLCWPDRKQGVDISEGSDILSVPDISIDETLKNPIGNGGASDVYLYNWKGEMLAVKKFKFKVIKKRLSNVAKKLSQLKHPNIVQLKATSYSISSLLFEYCHVLVDDDHIHNVAELTECWGLDEIFEFRNRIDLVYQSSLGLQCLHNKSIIHKDFKPANLLAKSENGKIVVKLCDFDEVYEMKSRFKSIQTIQENRLKGFTINYLAPEICLGEQNVTTYQTDVYAWGISAFEMMTSIYPAWESVIFGGSDSVLLSSLKKKLCRNLTKFSMRYQECDKVFALQNLIELSWQEDPTERGDISKVSENGLLSNYFYPFFEKF